VAPGLAAPPPQGADNAARRSSSAVVISSSDRPLGIGRRVDLARQVWRTPAPHDAAAPGAHAAGPALAGPLRVTDRRAARPPPAGDRDQGRPGTARPAGRRGSRPAARAGRWRRRPRPAASGRPASGRPEQVGRQPGQGHRAEGPGRSPARQPPGRRGSCQRPCGPLGDPLRQRPGPRAGPSQRTPAVAATESWNPSAPARAGSASRSTTTARHNGRAAGQPGPRPVATPNSTSPAITRPGARLAPTG
jgi:hypothetical protein